MIIVMKKGATESEINEVLKKIENLGYNSHPIYGVERVVIGAVGDERGKKRLESLSTLDGVENVVPILKPYKLASREFKQEKSVIKIRKKVKVGSELFTIIAGPCSVENEGQIIDTAVAVKNCGAHILRGGAFKPRTSPYSFQGLEEEGLKLLSKARKESGLPFVTEVVNPEDVNLVAEYADIMQVGARNAQNFALLKKLGRCDKPILLKRGMMTTIQEFLMSAEYLLSEGNKNIILCERGIRTFETATRNTLDISAVPVLQERTHLPVIIDPSHATGNWKYVIPMALASLAAGADGIMVEVHPKPDEAESDGAQSLKPYTFGEMVEKLRGYANVAGRVI